MPFIIQFSLLFTNIYPCNNWSSSDDCITEYLALPHSCQLAKQRAGMDLVGVELLVTIHLDV